MQQCLLYVIVTVVLTVNKYLLRVYSYDTRQDVAQ
jgi:hypothetical protein